MAEWEEISKDWENLKSSPSLLQLVLEGISDPIRKDLWGKYAEDTKNSYPANLYQNLRSKQGQDREMHCIEMDLSRTFPPTFVEGENREKLRNILRAYSVQFPSLGYISGMSFIAGILLMQVEEEEAFWLFVYIMEKVGLKDMYFMTDYKNFEDVMREECPNILERLDENALESNVFMNTWLRTIFAMKMSPSNCFKIFDLFFILGKPLLFHVALAVLKSHPSDHDISDFIKFNELGFQEPAMESLINTLKASN